LELLQTHLLTSAPWGAEVTVSEGGAAAPFSIDARGPVYDAAREAFRQAWDGVAPVDIGVGGSIPFIAAFAEVYPEASIVVTGIEDPDTRAHGANEGLHLGEFSRACLAEALFLAALADSGTAASS
jgi:acetylornithine deacetylase/succinyl-diaminopimelate desuccinylase-like protein